MTSTKTREAEQGFRNAAAAAQAHYAEMVNRAEAEFGGDEDAAYAAMSPEWRARHAELTEDRARTRRTFYRIKAIETEREEREEYRAAALGEDERYGA